jgi:hypothetical protein
VSAWPRDACFRGQLLKSSPRRCRIGTLKGASRILRSIGPSQRRVSQMYSVGIAPTNIAKLDREHYVIASSFHLPLASYGSGKS